MAQPRPPATLEDFLWNLHTVLSAAPSPLVIDGLKDAYAKQLGHKFAIERYLVGDQGLSVTLKKIPHIVTQFQANGTTCVKATQATSSTKEQLLAADMEYRRTLARKNAAAVAAAKAKAGAGAPAAAKAAPAPDAAAAKAPAGPTRPPSSLEDFLWNVHTVLAASDAPVALDQLPDTYSKHLGHKFAIERFLVVKDGDIGAGLRKIPHIITMTSESGKVLLTPTLAKASTREGLTQADQDYRKSLQQKAKAKSAAPAVAVKAPAPAPAPAAAPAPVTETRPSEGGGEPEAKRQKKADGAAGEASDEILSKMLVQGVVRVLQARNKDGMSSLPVSQLPDEFKTFWKLPFNMKSAGYNDVNAFLKAWPNKVEVTSTPTGDVVSLAKKALEKTAVAAVKSSALPPAAAPTAIPSAIPSTAAEIQKELARNANDLLIAAERERALLSRQKALVEALTRHTS